MIYTTTIDDESSPPVQRAWRVNDWLRELGHPFSRVTMYKHIAAGKIQARKAGHNLLIVTPPAEFLASCPPTLGPAPRRRNRSAA
jgi:hypothetical protein